MLKHNIEQFNLKDHDEDQQATVVKSDGLAVNRTKWWEGDLLVAIAQANLCEGFYNFFRGSNVRTYYIIGDHTNIEFVRMLHEYLVPFLRNEAKRGIQQDLPSNPNAYKRAFFRAARQRIYARLQEQQRLTTAGTGLVLYNRKGIDDYLSNLNLRAARQKNLKDQAGAWAGHLAGDRADISAGRKLNP